MEASGGGLDMAHSNNRKDFFYLSLFYPSIIIPIVKIVFAHMLLSYESTRATACSFFYGVTDRTLNSIHLIRIG